MSAPPQQGAEPAAQGSLAWRLRVPLACLLALALAEFTVRAADPTAAWIHAESGDFAVRRWAWEREKAAHRETSLLVIGNSGARDGVDAEVLAHATGWPAFNFGIAGESIEGMTQLRFDATHDGVALLMLNTPLLDYRHDVDPRHPWRIEGAWLAALRGELRAGIDARFRRLWDDDPVRTGRVARAVQYDDELGEAELAHRWSWIEDEIASHPPSPATDAALLAAIDAIRSNVEAAGYRFAVAWLPERRESPYLQRLARRREVVAQHLAEGGVAIYRPDVEPGWESFRDAVHLNADGRADNARRIARWLQASALL